MITGNHEGYSSTSSKTHSLSMHEKPTPVTLFTKSTNLQARLQHLNKKNQIKSNTVNLQYSHIQHIYYQQ